MNTSHNNLYKHLLVRIFTSVVLLLLLYVFPSCVTAPQNNCMEISPDSEWLKDMATAGSVDRHHSVVGLFNCQNPQWQRYRIMKEQISADSLLRLTEHPEPALRCYAFFALYEKGYPHLFNILLHHLNDSALVSTCSNDCPPIDGEETEEEVEKQLRDRNLKSTFSISQPTPQWNARMVGDVLWMAPYFCDTLCAQYPVRYLSDRPILSVQERATLDSLFLYCDDIPLLLRARILRHLQSKESDYQRIRYLAKEKKDMNVLVTLAAYRKQEDIPLLQQLLRPKDSALSLRNIRSESAIVVQHLTFAFVAEKFPDTVFFSSVVTILAIINDAMYMAEYPFRGGIDISDHFVPCNPEENGAYWRRTKTHAALMRALAQYRTENAKKQIREILSAKGRRQSVGFRNVLMSVLWRLWKKSPDPYFSDIVSLIEQDSVFAKNKTVWERSGDIP